MNLNHAHVKSDFSIGESLLQVDYIIDRAKELGYETVTLCDTMSVHGMVDFSNKAKKAGIKPIIGCVLRVYDDPTYKKPSKSSGEKEKPNNFYMLKVYATDERGIKSLLSVLSTAYSAERFYYHARCGLDDVMGMEGIAVSTGDLYNVFHNENYEGIVSKLAAKFPTYVELVPINTPLFDTLNGRALSLVKNHGFDTLVTYPALCVEEGDFDSLDVLGCVTTNTQMDVPYRPKQFVKDFYLAAPKHIVARVKEASIRMKTWNAFDLPTAWVSGLQNLQKLADSCSYEFKKQPVCLPKMAENEFVTLGKKCVEGWRSRFATSILGYRPSIEDLNALYKPRLEFELGVLKKMNFCGYFLLVEDLVTWSKNNEIIVGPGRGSSGGSLVAYLLGITDVDPIRFNLLFERFINPERQDLPDADLDFMSSKRHLVVEYLTEKYGKDYVAGISNYSTMASASALRDAGRMYGMTGIDLMATKLVPKEHGQSFTLTEAAEAVPELELFRDSHREIWNHALKLEGAMRSFGQHAAGVIVAGEPLTERAVVETRGESPVVNWDKRVVEDWGLIKMDLLGLSTLDVLEIAKQYIKERHGVTVDYLKLSLEETDVMAAFGRGDTTGVFQAEGPMAKKLLRDMAKNEPLSFNDVVAMNALNRPGPLESGLAESYVRRKQGIESVEYPHPRTEAALKNSLGIMVYQENLMQVARDLCGFTMADADVLRKAIGKKDPKLMATMKSAFVKGAVAGYADVELEDGRIVEVNVARRFKVKGRDDKFTVEEILSMNLELNEIL
jgi:DNA polymerase-3 subunit alpha